MQISAIVYRIVALLALLCAFFPPCVARQMVWTPPALMFRVRRIEWTLAGRRHHSAQVGSIRFPGKPEGPDED